MTDNLMTQDFNWEEKPETIEESGKTRFAKARLYFLYVARFQKGQHFTLPGVYFDEYDEATQTSIRQELAEFRAMTLSNKKKWRFYPFVVELKNATGQWYQQIKKFGNWDKAWEEFQFSEVDALSVTDKKRLTGAAKVSLESPDSDDAWAYIKYLEAETGYDGEYDIKKYLSDITVYPDKTSWEKDEAEWQARFNDGDNPTEIKDYHPASWQGNNPIEHGKKYAEMMKYLQSDDVKNITDPKELAQHIMLVVNNNGEYVDKYENGVPAQAINGNPVPVAKVLSELLNRPEQMLGL